MTNGSIWTGGSVNKKIKYLCGVIWLTFFSISFAAVWIRTPALWFVNLPKSVWAILANYTEGACCERIADLEILVGLGFGFLIGFLLMYMFLYLKSRRKLE